MHAYPKENPIELIGAHCHEDVYSIAAQMLKILNW